MFAVMPNTKKRALLPRAEQAPVDRRWLPVVRVPCSLAN